MHYVYVEVNAIAINVVLIYHATTVIIGWSHAKAITYASATVAIVCS